MGVGALCVFAARLQQAWFPGTRVTQDVMIVAIYTVFIINCFFLCLVVLLQSGKGGGMAGIGGGGSGSATVFGNRGATTFVQKLTIASAALFMALSMLLAYLSTTSSATDAGEFRPAAVAPVEMPGAIPLELAPVEEGESAPLEVIPMEEETLPGDGGE